MQKISEQELKEVLELKQDIDNSIYYIGQTDIQIQGLHVKLKELQQEKDNELASYYKLIEKEKSIANSLSTKYGQGQLNLETGEIRVS